VAFGGVGAWTCPSAFSTSGDGEAGREHGITFGNIDKFFDFAERDFNLETMVYCDIKP